MRKEFKNGKAKHGLNSKKWERRQIGIRPNMALLLRPKYLLVYKIRMGELKRIGEGERRRRREEKKEEGRGVQGRFKGMESNLEYGLLGFLVWIHVCGLWVVRNLTLE